MTTPDVPGNAPQVPPIPAPELSALFMHPVYDPDGFPPTAQTIGCEIRFSILTQIPLELRDEYRLSFELNELGTGLGANFGVPVNALPILDTPGEVILSEPFVNSMTSRANVVDGVVTELSCFVDVKMWRSLRATVTLSDSQGRTATSAGEL